MSMNVGGDNSDVMVDINTTPLIDVMLVLLIMFIITIPIQTHAVKMNMPIGPSSPPLTEPVIIRIDVDFDGQIGWNGEIVPDRATLESRLRAVALEPNQPEVHLRPNKLVQYETVAMIMASAQRLGVTKIGLVGNEQFLKDLNVVEDDQEVRLRIHASGMVEGLESHAAGNSAVANDRDHLALNALLLGGQGHTHSRGDAGGGVAHAEAVVFAFSALGEAR